MPSIRIVTISAVFLSLTAGGALAQTATTTAPGKPLQLFQVVEQKDDAAVKIHHRARYVHRRVARARVVNQTTGAARHTYMQVQPEPEQAATTSAAATPLATTPMPVTAAATPVATTTAVPANIWPAPDSTPSGMQTLTRSPPAAVPTAAFDQPVATPNPDDELTAAYHTVQVTPPSAVQTAAPDTVQVTPPDPANSTNIAADHQHETANAAAPNNSVATWPVQRAMVAAAAPESPNPVGSVSWIVHVLAAFGATIAAGALAWVLINPLPVRSYE